MVISYFFLFFLSLQYIDHIIMIMVTSYMLYTLYTHIHIHIHFIYILYTHIKPWQKYCIKNLIRVSLIYKMVYVCVFMLVYLPSQIKVFHRYYTVK